jgi:hypothetical protein
VSVAEAKRQAGETIVLYGHPDRRLGRYPAILRTLLAEIDGKSDVWQTNCSSLARWSDARDRQRWTLSEIADGWMVEAVAADRRRAHDHPFALELSVGSDSVSVPLGGGPVVVSRSILHRSILRRSILRPTANSTTDKLPQPIRREFLSGFKPRLRRWLDWERTTPLGEIGTDHWRGRLKRTLRQVTA